MGRGECALGSLDRVDTKTVMAASHLNVYLWNVGREGREIGYFSIDIFCSQRSLRTDGWMEVYGQRGKGVEGVRGRADGGETRNERAEVGEAGSKSNEHSETSASFPFLSVWRHHAYYRPIWLSPRDEADNRDVNRRLVNLYISDILHTSIGIYAQSYSPAMNLPIASPTPSGLGHSAQTSGSNPNVSLR